MWKDYNNANSVSEAKDENDKDIFNLRFTWAYGSDELKIGNLRYRGQNIEKQSLYYPNF